MLENRQLFVHNLKQCGHFWPRIVDYAPYTWLLGSKYTWLSGSYFDPESHGAWSTIRGQKWSCCFMSAETFSKMAIYTSFGNVKKCVKQICTRCCSDHVRDAECIVVTSRGLYRVANFPRFGKYRKRTKLDEKGKFGCTIESSWSPLIAKLRFHILKRGMGTENAYFQSYSSILKTSAKVLESPLVCKLLNRGQQTCITLLTLPKDGLPFSRKCRPITQYDCYSDLRVSCLRGCAIFITL